MVRDGSRSDARRSHEARVIKGEDPDMAIDKVLADVAVDDFVSALTWYERLLGRPADAAPMDGLAEWHLAEGGGSK